MSAWWRAGRVGRVLREVAHCTDRAAARRLIAHEEGASHTEVSRSGSLKPGADAVPGTFRPPLQEPAMLHYAVVFFVIALIAALFGFGGIAASAVGIAKILFIVFAVLAIASFLFGSIRKR